MSTRVVVAMVCATLVLGACRREVPYEPLKLGASMPPASEPLR